MSGKGRDDFYVGYLKQAPKELAGVMRGRIIALLLSVAAVALLVTLLQAHFNPGTFEFGKPESFRGVVRLNPYPILMAADEGAACRYYFLVNQGKFGADDLLADFNGKQVKFEAARIYRDNQVMLEIVPGSVKEAVGVDPCQTPPDEDLGEHTLTGEIVDSKCYLGVMSPGNLKTHKSCAIRCIAGGIPPVLVVRDERGQALYLVLVDTQLQPVNDRVLDMIAEPVEITGRVGRYGDLLYLVADPEDYRRLAYP